MAYGVGQGLAQGVQQIAGFALPVMRMKQEDKHFYDRLALDQAWKDGFYGGPSPLEGEASAPGDPNASVTTDGSGQPYQVTRPAPKQGFMDRIFGKQEPTYTTRGGGMTPGETLALGRTMGSPTEPGRGRSFPSPTEPAPAGPMAARPAAPPASPGVRQPNVVRPNTPLPPMSMMRSGFRRPF